MGVGVVSTLLFYWLVRQDVRQLLSDDQDRMELSEPREANVRPNATAPPMSTDLRRKASQARDLNRADQPVADEPVNPSENRKNIGAKSSDASDLKIKMTIKRWFKQPQLYQVNMKKIR
jgi:hypothetical protein